MHSIVSSLRDVQAVQMDSRESQALDQMEKEVVLDQMVADLDTKVLQNRKHIQSLNHVQLVNVQCVQLVKEHQIRTNL